MGTLATAFLLRQKRAPFCLAAKRGKRPRKNVQTGLKKSGGRGFESFGWRQNLPAFAVNPPGSTIFFLFL